MPLPNPTSAAVALSIPEEVQKKFPEFIELIQKSPSMNLEERQYWVDVLLIMTDEQLANLKNILMNEKKQLEEASRQFKEGVKKDSDEIKVRFDEIKYKEKKRVRYEAERKSEKEEKTKEEDLLKAIQSM